jgi:hypothetical protein
MRFKIKEKMKYLGPKILYGFYPLILKSFFLLFIHKT